MSFYTSTTCFLILFNSNVSNSYYSLNYISQCYLIQNTLNSYMLTHNSLFCEHITLWEYHPGTTSYPNPRSTLTIKTNSSFGFWWYSSYLSSVGPINQNESIASITYRLTIQLSKTPNTGFGQKPGKNTKSREKTEISSSTLGLTTNL